MERERLIFHIDVNSAFLSWESVARLREDPAALDLRTIPSAVGGDASKRHGIVLAKSTPAKAFGVATGEPLAQALRKCPTLVVVPSHYELYVSFSRKLIHLLEDYTPDIEKFSIDEAFLDMTETIHLFGSPAETADAIRRRVREELGFTVNVGIAPNKLLAKMASDFEKPDRTHTLFREEIPSKMWPLPIRDLFLVGGAAQRKMEAMGLRTIGDLARCDLELLRSQLGDKYSRQIHRYANGIDDEPVEERAAVNKGYGNRITLARDVSDTETACQVLLSLAETVGARLRADHVLCNQVCVELRDWRFRSSSHQGALQFPTDSTSVIYEEACRLLREFWDGTPVRLIGIRTGKISDHAFVQMSLFETEQDRKRLKMEQAVDQIRSRFGTDSIKRASFLKKDSLVEHAASRHKHLGRSEEGEGYENS